MLGQQNFCVCSSNMRLLVAALLLAVVNATMYAQNYTLPQVAPKSETCALDGSMFCDDNEVVTVFVIPHTHNDVGWLLTVDQYYLDQVQWILGTR